jgi:hypothetical protein
VPITILKPVSARSRLEALAGLFRAMERDVMTKFMDPKTIIRFQIEAGGVGLMAAALESALRAMQEAGVE